MSGWMTFIADIRCRPEVTDVGAYLAHGVQAVRAHPEIAAAVCRHDPLTGTVAFDVQVSYPVAWHYDAITAHRALHENRERAGFGDTSLPPWSPVPVRLRIDSWPYFC